MYIHTLAWTHMYCVYWWQPWEVQSPDEVDEALITMLIDYDIKYYLQDSLYCVTKGQHIILSDVSSRWRKSCVQYDKLSVKNKLSAYNKISHHNPAVPIKNASIQKKVQYKFNKHDICIVPSTKLKLKTKVACCHTHVYNKTSNP